MNENEEEEQNDDLGDIYQLLCYFYCLYYFTFLHLTQTCQLHEIKRTEYLKRLFYYKNPLSF